MYALPLSVSPFIFYVAFCAQGQLVLIPALIGIQYMRQASTLRKEGNPMYGILFS
jgi:hypothetical protein